MIEVVHVYRDALFDAFPPEELPEGYVGSTVYPLMNGDGDDDGENDGENKEGEDGEHHEGDKESDTQQDDDHQQDNAQHDNDDLLNQDGKQDNKDTTSNDTTSNDTTPNDITPNDTTPNDITPNDTTQHDTTPNDTTQPTTTLLSQHELDEQLTRLCLLVTPLFLSYTVPQRRLTVRTPPPGLQLPLQIPRRPFPRRPPAAQRIL